MIVKYPEFKSDAQKFDWLIKNESMLIDQLKSTNKTSDVFFAVMPVEHKDNANKAEGDNQETNAVSNKIKVKVIINTTGLLDSHSDVHIPGIWKKYLKEAKKHYLVNQHRFNFEGILSDEVKAYTEEFTWKELGYDYEGTTEALVYETVLDLDSVWIDSPENKKLYNLYKSGKVNNHSVGMRYMKLYMCINSTDADYAEKKDNWDKYFPYVANKEDALQNKFFWAVTEAKAIEGSAVLRGSNFATNTISVEEIKNEEAEVITSDTNKNEPSHDTQTDEPKLFINPNLI
ncbi:hypothetical protein K5I29_04185 [Flavobacterium agricola]|uniref:Uncharacterized protein n=1 Tax=Flavobacterium agricola TaxID=2870839 RepID=A0ABY6M461_9FLAO|nr:hypothetical protein [Flavobacterium agricola]UYW02106.1 hypothetical protein K5I29_04185 [Flavobacterium agricola]